MDVSVPRLKVRMKSQPGIQKSKSDHLIKQVEELKLNTNKRSRMSLAEEKKKSQLRTKSRLNTSWIDSLRDSPYAAPFKTPKHNRSKVMSRASSRTFTLPIPVAQEEGRTIASEDPPMSYAEQSSGAEVTATSSLQIDSSLPAPPIPVPPPFATFKFASTSNEKEISSSSYEPKANDPCSASALIKQKEEEVDQLLKKVEILTHDMKLKEEAFQGLKDEYYELQRKNAAIVEQVHSLNETIEENENISRTKISALQLENSRIKKELAEKRDELKTKESSDSGLNLQKTGQFVL